MIQGHLFRAYLLPSIRQLPWYKIHEVLHGFVAPGFLFAAGFTAFLSFHNKRQNYIRLDGAFFKRLRRILFVIAVGYWIHLPFLSLRKTLLAVGRGQAGNFLRVDILQCIGTGLLLFTLLAVLLKGERAVTLATALAGALFFLLPEAVKDIRLHPVLDPYFDYRVSLFPLFPWLGYLCLGVVAAFLYSRLQRRSHFGLLLTLDEDALKRWKLTHNIPESRTVREMAADPVLRAEIQDAVNAVNATVSHAEAIKKFYILDRDLTEEADELTPTMKVKRNVVALRYAEEIAQIYKR